MVINVLDDKNGRVDNDEKRKVFDCVKAQELGNSFVKDIAKDFWHESLFD